jgi:competence protein ComEC
VPDILIARDASSVAVRGRDSHLHIMSTAKNAFLWREWLAADADPRAVTDPSLARDVACDEAGCVVEGREGDLVALARQPEALADDCARAKIIVTPHRPPSDCAAQVFHRDHLGNLGGVSLKRTPQGYGVIANQAAGTDRPWSPAPPEASSGSHSNSANVTGRKRPSEPVDATPPEAERETAD